MTGSRRGVLFRIEDLLLAAWLVVVGPALAVALHPDRGSTSGGSRGSDPVSGAVSFLACAAAVVFLASRDPGTSPYDTEGQDVDTRAFALFPFAAGVGILASEGSDLLGIPSELVGAAAFIAAGAAFIFGRHLPVLPTLTRRALLLPFTLVAGSFFQGIVAEVASGITDAARNGFADVSPNLLVFEVLLIGLATGVFYAMLVFAPRRLVEEASNGVTWILRYLLFLGGTVLGAVIAGHRA